jgi:hypothetical protein
LLAEQQVVHDAEELARLGSLDHAVVVRAGQRDDLAHPDVGERFGIGADTPLGPVRFEYGTNALGRGGVFVRIGRWF